MSRKRTCFVKLDRDQHWLWEFVIVPALNNTNYMIRTIVDEQTRFESAFDWTVSLIKDSDLIITRIDNFSANNCYELGLAHAWGKPTIVFSNNIDDLPANIARMPLISTDFAERSGGESSEKLRKLLLANISMIENKRGLIDTTIERYSSVNRLVSINLDLKTINPIDSFKYISELLACIGSYVDPQSLQLVEIQNNSLQSVVELGHKRHCYFD